MAVVRKSWMPVLRAVRIWTRVLWEFVREERVISDLLSRDLRMMEYWRRLVGFVMMSRVDSFRDVREGGVISVKILETMWIGSDTIIARRGSMVWWSPPLLV